jgi:hypothetical protein
LTRVAHPTHAVELRSVAQMEIGNWVYNKPSIQQKMKTDNIYDANKKPYCKERSKQQLYLVETHYQLWMS